MKKEQKIEAQTREFTTNEQREDYLRKMNEMHERYASLDHKINKMNEQWRWNTDKVIDEIE